ncbi:hypothetical protein HY386_01275 [Candidatus Daviesbacteria bacterium]|nr:hypothetical protein [Candidatus Daviesbacteria bacterium]
METEPNIEVQRKASLVLWHVDGFEKGKFDPAKAPNFLRTKGFLLNLEAQNDPGNAEKQQKAREYGELIQWVEENPRVDSGEAWFFREAYDLLPNDNVTGRER